MIWLSFKRWVSSQQKYYNWKRLYLMGDDGDYWFWTPIIIGRKRRKENRGENNDN